MLIIDMGLLMLNNVNVNLGSTNKENRVKNVFFPALPVLQK